MRQSWVIARKEFQLALRSISSYIVYLSFLIIMGSFFGTTIFKIGLAEMRGIFGFIHILLIFFVPAITMGSIAKEKQSGTFELISTLPLRLSSIVWGKALSAFLQILLLISFSLVYLAIISIFGEGLDWGAVLTGYLGILLVAFTHIAIGIFASSLPSNQVMAFIIAFAISAAFYVLRFLLVLLPLPVVRVLQYFSFEHRLANCMKGVLDLRDLLFFLGLALLFIFLAEFNLQAKNMKQER